MDDEGMRASLQTSEKQGNALNFGPILKKHKGDTQMEDTNQFKAVDAQFVNISIPSIEAVKEFVSTVTNFACDATLRSGRYIVDAKSIMGVFSLDATKPIKMVLEVGRSGIDDRDDLCEAIKQFIIE